MIHAVKKPHHVPLPAQPPRDDWWRRRVARESIGMSVVEVEKLAKREGISWPTVYEWRRKFFPNVAELKKAPAQKKKKKKKIPAPAAFRIPAGKPGQVRAGALKLAAMERGSNLSVEAEIDLLRVMVRAAIQAGFLPGVALLMYGADQ